MELTTPRLLLRPWVDGDAEALFSLASDPAIGPAAGWTPHRSVEESREIIRTILSAPGTYAILGRRDGILRGSCGLFPTRTAEAGDSELEIGYWVGQQFWGRGIAPEAVERLLELGFAGSGTTRIWCAYFDGNERSRRCMEKCGFRPHHTERDVLWAATGERKTEHFCIITSSEWLARKGMEPERGV